ncbi:MAG: FAD-dependent monooxygenase [Myxococcales bacterium]
MNASTDIAVLIVGAGPTGLTLACELARRGQRVRIVEQNQGPMPGSRGKGLQPRTLELFDDLGIVDRVLARGTPYPRMRVHWGPFAWGYDLMERGQRTDQVPYPNAWMVAQADTEASLRERLTELDVEVEYGCALRGFTQDADAVRAELEHGTRSELVRTAYLLAADGGRSTVRKALGLTLQGRTLDEPSALVGDLVLDGLARDAWHVWPRARSGAVALCPLPGGEKFQLLAQLEPGSSPPALELAPVQAFLTHTLRSAKIGVRAVSWLSLYHPQSRMVDRYRVGRVLLAGDAAHVHPPTGGQGLNIGVQDSQNLGWKLAAVLDGAPDALLDTYQQERLPIAHKVLNLSTALYERRARQRRGADTKQLGTNYRDSSLSVDVDISPGVRLRSGDRAPDAVTNTGRLFDVFRGAHFTVLAFGADAARVQAQDARVRSVHVSDSFDRGGKIAAAYQAVPGSVVVVRPDGYIASRSDKPRAFALDAYLGVTRCAPPHPDAWLDRERR